MAEGTVNVLLVEDDDLDAEAITRAFQKHRIGNPIRRVSDGREALDLLRGEGEQSFPRPYLILLDLNMPRMNGIEFLNEVRNDPALSDSIIFVLTTSDDDRDKVAAYGKNVAGYMIKAKAGEDFLNLIEILGSYWRFVEFPPEKEQG